MGAYSFAQFIASPILGTLSDRYGRKIILIISKLGTALAYVIMAKSQSYEWFLAARLLDGFTGGNIAVARAYIADITTAENRAKGMAVIGISFGIGFLLGPILGGFLYTDTMAYENAAWVASALSGIATVLTILLLKEPKRHKEMVAVITKLRTGFLSLKMPVIQLICLVYFIYMIIFSCFETSFSVFTHYIFNYTPQQNSWLFVYAGCLSLIVQGTILKSKFKKITSVCMVGIASIALGMMGLSIANSLLIVLVTLALLSVGIGLANTFLPALLSLYTTPKNQGQVMGVYEGIGSLSRIIGPIVAYQWIMVEPRKGYFLCGLLLLIVMLLIGNLHKKNKKRI